MTQTSLETHREVPPFPETAETLAERTTTERMRVRGESARERTAASLEQLNEKINSRRYDPETPRLIAEIQLDELPENQRQKLDALRDVSMMMMASLLYHHRDMDISIITNFENLPQWERLLTSTTPRPAENQALQKLLEIRSHPDSSVSRVIRAEWPAIVRNARETTRLVHRAERFDGSQPPHASEGWLERTFRKYPKTTVACGIAGAIGGFFLVRGIFRWIFGSKKKESDARQEQSHENEEESGVWTWTKRLLFSGAAAFGLGYIIGFDRIVQWGKKLTNGVRDAWSMVFGENPEFENNRAMYERMARRISREMAVPVNKNFLAELYEEKYKDFIGEDSMLTRLLEDNILDTAGEVLDRVPGGIARNWVYTQEKRRQARAIRSYLKGRERQRIIANISIDDDTTLAQVMNQLDEAMNRLEGTPQQAGQTRETQRVSGSPSARSGEITSIAAGGTITNAAIEGIESRDETAQRLPENNRRLYIAQRRKLKELLDNETYVKNTDAEILVAAAEEAAQKIEDDAVSLPERGPREQKRREAEIFRQRARALRNAVAERTRRIQTYNQTLRDNASEENIHRSFLKVMEGNQEVAEAYNNLEEKIAAAKQIAILASLAVIQGIRIGRYISASRISREFIRHYYGAFGLPTAMVERLMESLKRPNEGIALTERRIHEAERRLRGDLGGASNLGEGSLENRAHLDVTDTQLIPEGSKLARARYERELSLLEHDQRMLEVEREIETLTGNKNRGPIPLSNADRLQTLQRELQRLRLQRIQKERLAIESASEEFYDRLRPEGDTERRALLAHEWRELDDLARRGGEHNRDIMRAAENTVEEIQSAVLRRAPQTEIDTLTRQFNESVSHIGQNQKNSLLGLSAFLENYLGRTGRIINRAMRAPGMARDAWAKRREIVIGAEGGRMLSTGEKTRFRKVIYNILHWQQGSLRATRDPNVPLFRVFGKKLAFYTLSLGAISSAVGLATKDKRTGFLRSAGQAAFEIAPLTGTYSDFHALITGREALSGRKVKGWERWALRPLFGLVGAASDIAVLAGGIGLLGRAGLGALRGAFSTARVVRSAGRVGRAGARAAVESSARSTGREAGEAAVESAARGAAREAAEITARTTSTTGKEAFWKALRRIQTVGTIATVALGIGSLGVSLIKSDEVEIPPRVAEIGGIEDITPPPETAE